MLLRNIIVTVNIDFESEINLAKICIAALKQINRSSFPTFNSFSSFFFFLQCQFLFPANVFFFSAAAFHLNSFVTLFTSCMSLRVGLKSCISLAFICKWGSQMSFIVFLYSLNSEISSYYSKLHCYNSIMFIQVKR